jgi:UPF0716 protein FxsA
LEKLSVGLILLLLFVALPLTELFLLLQLAEWTSGGFTFLLVMATGVVGAALARHQGWGVITRIRREMNYGQLPTSSLVDAVMIFVAGALLVTPGILTDLFGFSLLFPPCRRLYRHALLQWSRRHIHWESFPDTADFPGAEQRERDRVVDSRVVSRTVTDPPDVER